MYSVESDRSKRLLVISAAGRVTKKEVETVALQVREMMKEISPGFRVLTDFRWLDRMEPAAAKHIAEIMDGNGYSRVAGCPAKLWFICNQSVDLIGVELNGGFLMVPRCAAKRVQFRFRHL